MNIAEVEYEMYPMNISVECILGFGVEAIRNGSIPEE